MDSGKKTLENGREMLGIVGRKIMRCATHFGVDSDETRAVIRIFVQLRRELVKSGDMSETDNFGAFIS